MKRIIVIGSRNTGKKNDPSILAASLASQNVHVTQVYWEEIVFSIKTNDVKVLIRNEDALSDVDLLIAVGWYKSGAHSLYRDVAYALSLILDKKGIRYWNSEMGHQRSTSKLSAMVQLAQEGVYVPDTVFSLDSKLSTHMIPTPFVAKAAAASRGEQNFLIETPADITQLPNDVYLLVQPYLPNDHDLRVICFGGEPNLVLKRSRATNAKTHLNNTSQGGSYQWLELTNVPEEILTISRKICKIMNREMAGIDFIPDKSSIYHYSCLEVNAIPQLTSGVDANKKLAELQKTVQNLEETS